MSRSVITIEGDDSFNSAAKLFKRRVISMLPVLKKPELVGIITGRLRSIMTSYDEIEEGFRKVFFHTYEIDAAQFASLVKSFRETRGLFYATDPSRELRMIHNHYSLYMYDKMHEIEA